MTLRLRRRLNSLAMPSAGCDHSARFGIGGHRKLLSPQRTSENTGPMEASNRERVWEEVVPARVPQCAWQKGGPKPASASKLRQAGSLRDQPEQHRTFTCPTGFADGIARPCPHGCTRVRTLPCMVSRCSGRLGVALSDSAVPFSTSMGKIRGDDIGFKAYIGKYLYPLFSKPLRHAVTRRDRC